MNNHSKRVLRRTITLLEEYRTGKSGNLRGLVDGLEGSLNTLEEELPEDSYLKWYYHWGGLEQVLAAGTEDKRRAEILHDLDALETLLLQYLEDEQTDNQL